MSRHLLFRRLVSLAALVFAAGLLAACGRKADPVPPRHLPPPVVSDLAALLEGDRLTLTWSLPVPDEKIGRAQAVTVYQFRAVAGDSICPGCPPVFKALAEVDAQGKGGPMAYRTRLEKGYRYVFKVTVRGEDGVAGEDSNRVQVIFAGGEASVK